MRIKGEGDIFNLARIDSDVEITDHSFLWVVPERDYELDGVLSDVTIVGRVYGQLPRVSVKRHER